MTEKQYKILEFMKTNPGPHTAKEIALGLGRISDRYTYANSVLAKLESDSKAIRIASPCQPVRWEWVDQNDTPVQ